MILRRFTQHLKDQNWFAVGLDVIVVVVGIFLGMQVTEWNDDLNERKREIEILKEIASDVESDSEAYDVSINMTINKIAAINYLMSEVTLETVLSRPNSNDISINLGGEVEFDKYQSGNRELKNTSYEDRIKEVENKLWSNAILVANVQPSTAAFDSLFASGEIKIIKDKSLLNSLQEYRVTTKALINAQNVTFRPARNNAIEIGHKYNLSAFGDVSKSDMIKVLSEQPQLLATVQTQLGWAQGHFLMLEVARESATEVLEKIRAKLKLHNS